MIRGLGLSGFFLLHFDLLEQAREVAAEVRGPDSARALLPPGRGRGSSVSSVVCYLTGLSHVDPVKAGLFLGRFLNDEITEMPDIDLDFPRDIREKLIPRIHERYGRERAALVSAFATYRSRGAVRDLGKALGLPAGEIERVAGIADMYSRGDEVERDIAEAIGERRAANERWRHLAVLAREAWGLPRHVSQHPGGMVLSTRPLIDLCPVQPAAMEGRQIVQWDKDSCADAGFLKIDLLGLGMLSAVERCVEQIAAVRDERIDLSRIPLDDPEVFTAIRAAETTGVFQIESRAQMQMLPRSLPETIDDITVQVALVRPGPIQGGAVHPYLERKRLLREDPGYEIPYEHPGARADPLRHARGDRLPGPGDPGRDGARRVLRRRGGGPAAGDEPQALRGGAQRLRRALRRRRRRPRRRPGARRAGVRAGARLLRFRLPEVARRGVRAARLPVDLAAGPLRARVPLRAAQRAADGLLSPGLALPRGPAPRDRGPPRRRQRERRRMHRRAKPKGARHFRNAARSGSGSGTSRASRPRRSRRWSPNALRGGPYRDLADLASRSGIGRDGLERLAWAGACAPLGLAAGRAPRRDELWRLGVARGSARSARGRDHTQLALPLSLPAPPDLRPLDSWERIVADYSSTGVTLGEHPMAVMRPGLERRGDPHRRARDDPRSGPGDGGRAWSSPASDRRPRRGSSSCCSRTRQVSST